MDVVRWSDSGFILPVKLIVLQISNEQFERKREILLKASL